MEPTAEQILELVAAYAAKRHRSAEFDPSKPAVPVSGKVFGPEEVVELVRSSLDFWLTSGPETQRFQRALARRAGVRHALMVNSGSSANLLAISTLCASGMRDRRLRPGDEVITVAAGFPTTVNPIVQNGLVPVFVDVELPGYNIDVRQLEDALSPRTRAVVIAHTLGNPFDLEAIEAFCKRHELMLVEDCCDALGATYNGRPVGTFGDLATLSFYPAHQITTGEGGAVLMQRASLRRVAESLRDWGRDCWCDTGCDNTCGKRFSQQHGTLPPGYDHKYVYSEVGYNLKATDLQAAIGAVQLGRLDEFVARRAHNHARLTEGLADLQDTLVLPEAAPGARPSWFGFAHLSARGRTDLAQRSAPFPRGARDRHPPAVRGQPAPPAGVSGCRAPRGRAAHGHERCDRARVLDRLLPGADRRAHRLRDRPLPQGARPAAATRRRSDGTFKQTCRPPITWLSMSYTDAVSRVSQIQAQIASIQTAFDPSVAAATSAGSTTGTSSTGHRRRAPTRPASRAPWRRPRTPAPTTGGAALPSSAQTMLTSDQQQFASRLAVRHRP